MRIGVNGTHSLYSIKNPTNAMRISAIVDISSTGIPRLSQTTARTASPAKLVSPAGSAFRITFIMNFPLTMLLFGSSASTKDGAPMSIML
jgi:hypothetical protein